MTRTTTAPTAATATTVALPPDRQHRRRDAARTHAGSPTAAEMPAWKRGMDVAVATLGLVALAPALVLIAVAIKLTSRGPVLFAQRRVGQHGVPFTIYKFRTMVDGADAMKASLRHLNELSGPLFKIRHDPRITRLGRLLRRTSMDELPQLWNVLRGDMTLVGPRPATPDEVAQYEPWQRRRLAVRQGLTCFWQIEGRGRVGFPECVHMDLRYVDGDARTRFATDLRILVRTLAVVIGGRGAH